MPPPIGFILVTHNRPLQILRLTQRLAEMYGNAPVACHHDFGKCSLEGLQFPPNVTFVRPAVNTAWGRISVIHAVREALRLMYARGDSPDRFVLLSGADYPVRSSDKVIAELNEGDFDAHMDHRVVDYAHARAPEGTAATGFDNPGWVPNAYDRYIAIKLWVPGFSFRRRRPTRIPFYTVRSPLLVNPFNPFTAAFQCYGGNAWFSGNRKAAKVFLADSPTNQIVFGHFSKRFAPDEAVLQTILCNDKSLRISKDSKRYIDWTAGGHHPKTIGVEDIPNIIASGAHFARKFDDSSGTEVYDRVDEVVGALK